MDRTVADLRQNYTYGDLVETQINPDPIAQFADWFQTALKAELREPNAMTLATASLDGKPSARIVLLKHYDSRGFVFFTNYQSAKGKQLELNPSAALVFLWDKLERQVRIEGSIEKISNSESDDYFHSRPLTSQIGAWTSQQSQIIASREVLVTKQQELTKKYQDVDVIPRPSHWGGIRVIPTLIEFWQGRPDRLHDRLIYTQINQANWKIDRLSP